MDPSKFKKFNSLKHQYLLCFFMLFMASFAAIGQQKEVKPNFLFIVADDFGYHDMSCMGDRVASAAICLFK